MLELDSIRKYLAHVGAPVSRYDDFDIRKMHPDAKYNDDFEPFRHKIYSLGIYLEKGHPDGTISTDTFKTKLGFRTPYQVVSPSLRKNDRIAYFVCFTQKFLSEHKHLAELIDTMPYLRLIYNAPIILDNTNFNEILAMYEQIMKEFSGSRPDRFIMIASYLHTLMLKVKRLYEESINGNNFSELNTADELVIADKFRALLASGFNDLDNSHAARTVSYYAEKLAIHPNHLNALLKRTVGQTAQGLLHERLIYLAKTLLVNTRLSIKSVAYQLSFNEPAHFINFFKKHTGTTPAKFRTHSLTTDYLHPLASP